MNDSSCNLASLNLMRFVDEDGEFDVEAFRHACRLTITAQEILVDNASYPTPKIEENSHRFRPLGLGYANLGALLMSRGLAYDSPEGQALRRRDHLDHDGRGVPPERRHRPRPRRPVHRVREEPRPVHAGDRQAPRGGDAHPRRGRPGRPRRGRPQPVGRDATSSARATATATRRPACLAPTGTISFMLDCDTTGIEPDIALIKYKKLVGEGYLKIVNNTVPGALRQLGYTPDAGRGDRRLRRRARDDRGRARPAARAPARLRLRLQAAQRRPLDPSRWATSG